MGRIGKTGDISPTAVYLASSDSKYLTGETLGVTGGIYQIFGTQHSAAGGGHMADK